MSDKFPGSIAFPPVYSIWMSKSYMTVDETDVELAAVAGHDALEGIVRSPEKSGTSIWLIATILPSTSHITT